MKHYFLLLITFSLFLFSSCSKDDEAGTSSLLCSLEAKIDGSDWCGSANFTITDLGIAGVITSIGAGNTDMDGLTLQFMDNKTGTYDLSGSLASFTKSATTVYQSTSGTLTISQFENEVISGTFNFEAEAQDGSTVTVSSGKFEELKKQ